MDGFREDGLKEGIRLADRTVLLGLTLGAVLDLDNGTEEVVGLNDVAVDGLIVGNRLERTGLTEDSL